MIVECGYYDVDTVAKYEGIKKYYICTHRFNPTKLELIFEYRNTDGTLRFSGNNKELIKFIENGFR